MKISQWSISLSQLFPLVYLNYAKQDNGEYKKKSWDIDSYDIERLDLFFTICHYKFNIINILIITSFLLLLELNPLFVLTFLLIPLLL